MSEINVTPFVDVMLVLLIIFMVAAPLLTAGVPLNLPQSAADSLPRERKPPVAVSVDAEGRVFVGEEEIALESLPDRLAGEIQNPSEERVYVRADSEVGYGLVMRVMGELSASGYGNIGLVTQRRDGGAAQ